ncbi:lipase 1 isoform X3 [Rhipicephalus microplus]|uniref:lipase 1 isoform X3 n=1 Tax=Rhipicephalus microplus TaxID=6941 RepID=UPI00237649A6
MWVLVLAVALSVSTAFIDGSDVDRHANMSTCDLIMDFGYTCETFKTTTEDGYVLEADRVGKKKGLLGRSLLTPKHSPIILVPGILSESGTWFVNFPSQSPGYILADHGFDVWAMNTREIAARSRNIHHIRADDDRYWQWSFNEIGRYDLAATVDLVLNTTGASKVTLLAFSQGFTSSLVLLSTRPEYNRKVSLLMGYGPVANLSGVQFPFPQIIAVSDPIFTRMPVILAHYPIGTSYKNLRHFVQIYRTGRFAMYDYGFLKNIEKYGKAVPPNYPVERIEVPVALFSSVGDTVADSDDVSDLAQALYGTLFFHNVVPPTNFRHLDFVLGHQATDFLHENMLAAIDKKVPRK